MAHILKKNWTHNLFSIGKYEQLNILRTDFHPHQGTEKCISSPWRESNPRPSDLYSDVLPLHHNGTSAPVESAYKTQLLVWINETKSIVYSRLLHVAECQIENGFSSTPRNWKMYFQPLEGIEPPTFWFILRRASSAFLCSYGTVLWLWWLVHARLISFCAVRNRR